jgi:hypothetical protein
MGYYTEHSGRIVVTPPLDPACRPVLDGLGYVDAADRDATELVPDEGDIKAYRMFDDLRALVAACPGHEFTGTIHCVGEDEQEWRYVAEGRVVRQEGGPE